jgi:phosphoenolpyruvate-protein phosphotransferase (PTS system enzyme I)
VSLVLHGLGVSRGIAIGAVHVLKREDFEPVEETLADAASVENEVARLTAAVNEAGNQLREVLRRIPSAAPGDIGAFIDAHLMMLSDAAFLGEPVRIIRERRCNAEWALRLQRDALLRVFEAMEDPYLRTRRDDVDHVVQRILRVLSGVSPLPHESQVNLLTSLVVVADDLTPADTVQLQQAGIAAFVIEHGGPTSHTAILARSLGIPAIVGLPHVRRYLRDGEQVIVDGTAGVLLVAPDEAIITFYRGRKREERRYYTELIQLREAPSVTRDGVAVELQANIELTADFAAVRRVGAMGVGLYRTEFLYMNRATPPSEEEQFENYVSIFNELEGIPVTVRTVDLGSDKLNLNWQSVSATAANPALGVRGVRLCLREPGLFRAQLRAILRASAFGPMRMMVPMLATIQELRQVQDHLREVQQDLLREGLEFDPEMPVGGMIEVPAAALCADAFAEALDFLSIGTNDLIQYTMAIDRGNEEVSYLYDPTNPGVLRLIDGVIAAGARHGTAVAMCGEMAGDLRYIKLLLALGLRSFSVHPAALLEVKRVISQTTLEGLEPFAERTRNARSCADVRNVIAEMTPPARQSA